MALALGTITESPGTSASGPYNTSITAFSHNNGGASLLLVVIYTLTDGSLTVSNPQYNGVALTAIGTSNNTQNPGGCVWAGYLANPASGANNVTADITASGTNNDSYVAIAVPITGADLVDTVGVVQTESVTSIATTISHTNTTESNNSFHFMAGSFRDGVNAPPITPGAGMTEDVETISNAHSTAGTTAWLGHKLVATAGSDTVACTASSGERRSGISFEIKEDSGGGGGGTILPMMMQHAA